MAMAAPPAQGRKGHEVSYKENHSGGSSGCPAPPGPGPPQLTTAVHRLTTCKASNGHPELWTAHPVGLAGFMALGSPSAACQIASFRSGGLGRRSWRLSHPLDIICGTPALGSTSLGAEPASVFSTVSWARVTLAVLLPATRPAAASGVNRTPFSRTISPRGSA